jgi:hypothetical protein
VECWVRPLRYGLLIGGVLGSSPNPVAVDRWCVGSILQIGGYSSVVCWDQKSVLRLFIGGVLGRLMRTPGCSSVVCWETRHEFGCSSVVCWVR